MEGPSKKDSVIFQNVIRDVISGAVYTLSASTPCQPASNDAPTKNQNPNMAKLQRIFEDDINSTNNLIERFYGQGDYIRRIAKKWQLYLRLIIDTGLRRGELCALRWKDVDFDQNTISVAGNLCYNAQAGTYLDTPKSRQLRTVDVDPEIMAMLKTLKAEQKNICPSIWVFTQGGHAGDPKKPMHPQTPGRYMSKFAAKYGINHLHPHKLRHSFASIAITNGADIASISEKLGHADKSTTLRLYTHASQESMRRASQVFRDVLKDDGTEVCAPK